MTGNLEAARRRSFVAIIGLALQSVEDVRLRHQGKATDSHSADIEFLQNPLTLVPLSPGVQPGEQAAALERAKELAVKSGDGLFGATVRSRDELLATGQVPGSRVAEAGGDESQSRPASAPTACGLSAG
jgi:hypothetical protein